MLCVMHDISYKFYMGQVSQGVHCRNALPSFLIKDRGASFSHFKDAFVVLFADLHKSALVSDNDVAMKGPAVPWRLLKSRGVIHSADLDVVHSDTAEGWRMSLFAVYAVVIRKWDGVWYVSRVATLGTDHDGRGVPIGAPRTMNHSIGRLLGLLGG